ncbi:hypothetical protein DesLBE_0644 [Desulfitobacterium sp. LBE]|uniref:hypothetical protein n=1 Tax=Desulfitobacterium sp. LBE TaxID=884086 RepID=UPI00119B5759|nr:hypothetical protein [Desulfitobacterium sp. LBE]TWH56440.1 hypothetical protein DesLBE_0644 [Desulfitobacterium sp. LBE]
MGVVNKILEFIVGLLDKVLPALGIPTDFLIAIDGAIAWMIGLIESAGYFIPLDVLLMCLTVIFVFDNWTLLFRFGTWIIKLIRG